MINMQKLISSAKNGDVVAVNRLLEVDEIRANAAAEDNDALSKAAGNGHIEIVNRLLEIPAVVANASV